MLLIDILCLVGGALFLTGGIVCLVRQKLSMIWVLVFFIGFLTMSISASLASDFESETEQVEQYEYNHCSNCGYELSEGE